MMAAFRGTPNMDQHREVEPTTLLVSTDKSRRTGRPTTDAMRYDAMHRVPPAKATREERNLVVSCFPCRRRPLMSSKTATTSSELD